MYAAISRLRLEDRMALLAIIEEQTGIDWHRLGGFMSALRTGDKGYEYGHLN
jgi:hypothetical protein